MSGVEMLSARGAATADYVDFLISYMNEVARDPFHPHDNHQGIINMGTAVNRVAEDLLEDRLSDSDALHYSRAFQHYYEMDGTGEMKAALLGLLHRYFQPRTPLEHQHLVVFNGVSSCLDALAHVLCDCGDVIITPTPVYARIFTDMQDRAGAVLEPLVLRESKTSRGFELRAEDLEALVSRLEDEEGRKVRAFVLLNPHNPLGDLYTPRTLQALMEVCARRKIHFISDEIYALSVFKESEDDEDKGKDEGEDVIPSKFTSILSLDVPDPDRTHVVWGMSKDFGLAGFRVGVIVSRCGRVLSSLRPLAMYKCTPSIIQHAAATLLKDKEWVEDVYLRKNQSELGRLYRYARGRLGGAGVTVRRARAGLFVWFNVRPFMHADTQQEEMRLFEAMLGAGVYVVPGCQLHCRDPGWIRIVFSLSFTELQEGLTRILSVLKCWKEKSSQNHPDAIKE